MLNKYVLAIVAAASLGVSGMAVVTPARADMVYVEHRRDWHPERRCRTVIRDEVVWRHGERRVIQREVRICR